jgi:hypothetical protein
MRAICLFITALLFLPFANAQDPVANPTVTYNMNPFEKGKWNFDLRRNLSYSHFNNYSNEVKYAETNRISVDLGANYMFGKGIGAGLDLSYGSNKQKNESGSESSNNDWMLWGNFLYGRSLGTKFSWYGQASVGYGGDKQEFVPVSGTPNEDESNTLGFRITSGVVLPVQLGPAYLDAHLNYKRFCVDYEDGEESINRFGIGLNLMGALNANEFGGHNQPLNLRYRQGQSYIGYHSRAMYSFGNSTEKFNNLPNEFESDFSGGKLEFDYNYFFLNNFYGGVDFKWECDVSKPGNQPGYEFHNSDIMVKPRIGLNWPVSGPLHNFYTEVQAGWGRETFKIDDNGNVNEFKDKTSSYGVYLGYNFFISSQLAITPQAYWSVRKSESTDAMVPQEQEDKGFGLRVGARLFLDKF